MNIFSTMQSRLVLVFAALAFAGAATSQTMQVNNVTCANATVTIAQGIVNLTVPQACGTVTATAPVITAFAPSGTGTVAVAYPAYTFVASGSPTPTWSASGLPPGLSLSSGGVLTGTPTTAGTYSSVAVSATNTAGTDSKTLTITIAAPSGPPVITSGNPPATGAVGQSYSFTFTASGLQPITWSLATGNLPAGTTLNPTTGVLSGILTTGTSPYNFVVAASNASGAGGATVTTNSAIYAVTVSAPTAPMIAAASPPTTGTVGVAYTAYTFIATGTPSPTWTVASGALPAGMSLSTAGVLSGTPTAAGAATFTVKAANGTPPDAVSNSITITVANGGNCAPGNLSTDGVCMMDPSRTAQKITVANEPGRLRGPPAALSPLDGYSAEVATSCAASNAQLNANHGITTRWQHNIDLNAYRRGQVLEEFGLPPRHAISYRFVASTDIALPADGTGYIQLANGNSYSGSGYYMTLSTSPCDFDLNIPSQTDTMVKTCASSQAFMRFQVTSGTGQANYCKLTPGTTYYFNLRSLNTSTKQDSCLDAVCGGIFQIR